MHGQRGNDSPLRVRITETGWHLEGGEASLLDEGVIEDAIRQIGQEIETAPAPLGQPADGNSIAERRLWGPLLLQELLRNYRTHIAEEFAPPTAPLDCFDQRHIIDELQYRNQSTRIVELIGPSGIGKSHVLQALKKGHYSQGSPPGNQWYYVYVDVSKAPLTMPQIMLEFLTQLSPGPRSPDTTVTTDNLVEAIVNLMTDKGITAILFIVDGVDTLGDEVIGALAGPEGPVGEKLHSYFHVTQRPVLRLILAGRRPHLSQDLRKRYDISLISRRVMHPLDYNTVRQIVDEQWRTLPVPIGSPANSVVDDVATRVYDISGGYPKAVSYIVHYHVARRFVFPPVNYSQVLRPLIVRMVLRDIIGGLSVQEYFVLNVLSIFRQFPVGVIKALLNVGLLPANLLGLQDRPSMDALVQWLKERNEESALILPTAETGGWRQFAVHPVLRHVLPMDLEFRSPARFQQLHRIALQVYDNWLQQRDPSGVNFALALVNRPVYTMEALYHLLESHRGLAGDTTPTDLAAALMERAATYKEFFQEALDTFAGQYALDLNPVTLIDAWRQDEHLQAQFRRLPEGQRIADELEQLFLV